MRECTVSLTVNGVACSAEVEPRLHLADLLREKFGLTGTHVGCEHGVCGACTVLVDGASVRSCLMLAVQAQGRNVQTVEGVAGEGTLTRLQVLLSQHHGLQCGFCTPGVIMTLMELQHDLAGQPITEAGIRHALSGNLCRCTGYQGMVKAALVWLNRLNSDQEQEWADDDHQGISGGKDTDGNPGGGMGSARSSRGRVPDGVP